MAELPAPVAAHGSGSESPSLHASGSKAKARFAEDVKPSDGVGCGFDHDEEVKPPLRNQNTKGVNSNMSG